MDPPGPKTILLPGPKVTEPPSTLTLPSSRIPSRFVDPFGRPATGTWCPHFLQTTCMSHPHLSKVLGGDSPAGANLNKPQHGPELP